MTAMTTNPLPKETTDQIRYILEGIQSGKLKHEQRAYHSDCGTAHCVAGWLQVLDYEKLGGALEDLTWENTGESCCKEGTQGWTDCDSSELDEYLIGKGYLNEYEGTESYAARRWGLSYEEAVILFNVDSTLPEQFALLKRLEAGERIND